MEARPRGEAAPVEVVAPREVLAHFGATVLADLGGRASRNWLVMADGARAVLRRYPERARDIGFELAVLRGMDGMGWPVPVPLAPPVELGGRTWALHRWLPGEPAPGDDAARRSQGRLLAELHLDLERLDLGQRDGWPPLRHVVDDPVLYEHLGLYERFFPEDARMLRWHAQRARELFTAVGDEPVRRLNLHGDLAPWNLLYDAGTLSGVLDFEFTHRNFAVADFALSWRGKYDAVVHGYDEVQPLEDAEWALLTPVYWAWVFFGVADEIRAMVGGHIEPARLDWTLKRLSLRSPLMGPEAAPYKPPR